jgi:nitroimidazol reductase NimA-like FMN-containing flavoprotein (pyridoxamine 5'-phosphate oxidase superfamily)
MRAAHSETTAESGTEVLSEDECIRLLERHDFGRVAVVVDGEPRIFPVNYAMLDRVISIRTAAGTKLAHAPGSEVGFEIDGFDAVSGYGWSVMVQGQAVDATSGLDDVSWTARDATPRPVAPGAKPSYLAIQARSISGRRFTGIKIEPSSASA